MTKDELLAHLQDALQREDALSEDMMLEDIEEWDSLAILSVISLYDSLFHIKVFGNELRECKSIKDVILLAKDIEC